MVMLGFEEAEATKPIIRLIKEKKIAGVILFKRNCETFSGVEKLCKTLHSTADYPLLIGIDEEGGRVTRLPHPFKSLPSMREIAKSYTPEETAEIAYEQGEALIKLGINLNFAPVMDVDTNPQNPIIGDRSFSSDPGVVSTYGCAYIAGLQSAGVAACAKHFPGHGDTDLDSHTALPIVRHSVERLNSAELPPFSAAIESNVASIMTAHIICEALDSEFPATMSEKIVRNVLREQLGFEGVVFTDDLLMSAVKDNYDWLDVVSRSVSAGCDILLICKQDTGRLAFAFNELELMFETESRPLIESAINRIDTLARSFPVNS